VSGVHVRNNSDTWTEVTGIYVRNNSDTWTQVTAGYIRDNSDTWVQFWPTTRAYTFYLGNTVYIGTNGYISFDSGQTALSITGTVGRVLGILPADLVTNSVRWAADSSKFYVFYRGRRFSSATNFEIEYEVHFTDGQDYALIKLVAFPTDTYSNTAYYVDGSRTGYSAITSGRAVGGEYRVYFGATAAFSTTFTEYGSSTHPVWLASATPTSGDLDEGYFTIVANQGSSPSAPTSIEASSITGTTATVSWGVPTDRGMSAIQSYAFSTNGGGSWASTGSGTSVNLTGLTASTSYTVLVRATNYFFTGTNYASVTFTTSSVPPDPTITLSSITATGFTATFVSEGATSFSVDVYRFATLVSASGYPTTITGTSISPTGLTGTVTYAIDVVATNSAGSSGSVIKIIGGTPAVTFATNVTTADGFTGSVSNRSTNYTYSFAISAGTLTLGTASGTSYPFTVSGLAAGASATVTVTATRTDYFNGTGSTTGTAAAPAPVVWGTMTAPAFERSNANSRLRWGWNNQNPTSGDYTASNITWEWQYSSSNVTTTQVANPTGLITSGTRPRRTGGGLTVGGSTYDNRVSSLSGDYNLTGNIASATEPVTFNTNPRYLRYRAVVVGTNGLTYRSLYSVWV
jgi:hypothetical protein